MTFQPKSATMVRTTGYRWAEMPPHPALARWISSYWTIETGPGRHVIRTVPDACVDVTVRLGRTPRAFVAGTHPRAHSWRIRGRLHLFGARLLPGTAALLGIDAAALAPDWTPLDAFVRRAVVARLLGATARAADDAARAAAFDAFFSDRLLNRQLDPRLAAALRHVFAAEGQVAVAALAKQSGAHARTLVRLFERSVGLSPKRFARVVRLQAALRALPARDNWTHLAADLGYHDQAHFIHDVRELLGATPHELAALAPHTR
jgi:AraC-like DNA-binding protein